MHTIGPSENGEVVVGGRTETGYCTFIESVEILGKEVTLRGPITIPDGVTVVVKVVKTDEGKSK